MSTPNNTGRQRSDSPYGDSFNKALRHKDALFSMAQILTLDQDRALQLVEKTYARAMNGPALNQIDIQDRRYMLQLLIELYEEESRAHPSLFAPDESRPAQGSPRMSENIKRQLIQDALKQITPLAFASLDHSDRVLLILCEVEQLSCADASLILGSDSEFVCARLENARRHLKGLIFQSASPDLTRLLAGNPEDDWLNESLITTFKTNYKAIPARLESRIRNSVSSRGGMNQIAAFAQTGERRSRDIQSPNSIGNRTVRLVITLVLILTAGLAGYIGTEILETQPDQNLISLSARQAKRIKPILTTSDVQEAQDFIINHLNWRLTLPEINGSVIKGVGISEIVTGARVPVFLYEDETEGTTYTLYAFTYAILDEFHNQIELSQETLKAITDQDHIDKYELSSGNNVFVWRSADDIFLAVAPETELRDRIQVE